MRDARRARAAEWILQEVRQEHVSPSRGRAAPRGVKRKIRNFRYRLAVAFPRATRTTPSTS